MHTILAQAECRVFHRTEFGPTVEDRQCCEEHRWINFFVVKNVPPPNIVLNLTDLEVLGYYFTNPAKSWPEVLRRVESTYYFSQSAKALQPAWQEVLQSRLNPCAPPHLQDQNCAESSVRISSAAVQIS